MSNQFKPKLSLSQEMFSSFALHKKEVPSKENAEPGSSYEVFRNGTTAVELVVKDVGNRQRKNDITHILELKKLQNEVEILRSEVKNPKTATNNDATLKTLQAEIDKLKAELNEANASLNKTKKSFRIIMQGMKKQLDLANQKELEEQTKNVTLQFENEKLATLLISKSNLVNKFKDELVNLKRALKFVVKNISSTPKIAENFDYIGFKNYEDDLKRQGKIRINNLYDGTTTFDSSMSKDAKSSVG
ncbi:hypothetical protein K1T71_010955 [Dendrolimus kikuchii]|uniref:Uncharacterized protein n=1 Tax=Dendrolimus kikuchii TaxID=765133 RepID=A0ACC1CQC4_9NEOP|nr:hypothetical protein K1T71_010955 [Dendrolimus kikuchii]